MVEYQLHAVTFLQWAIRQPIRVNQEEREQLDVEARTLEETRSPAEQLKYLTTFRGEGNQPTRLAQRLRQATTLEQGASRIVETFAAPTDDGRGEDVGSTPDEGVSELGGATEATSDTTTEPTPEDTVVEEELTAEEQRRRDEEKAAEIARPYVALTDAMKSGVKARTRAAC